MASANIKSTSLYATSAHLAEELVGGPGTKGKDSVSLAEDKEKRRHLYVRCMPNGEATIVRDAQESELLT